MLEAMQMTFVTAPDADGARSPAAGWSTFRWVMIPGNEPTGDGRFVGITTVTTRSGCRSAASMGRDDLADDDELDTMLGRGHARRRGERVLHAWTTAHDRRRDRRRVRRRRACRRRSSATAPSCRGSTSSRARDVFVRQPGEAWIRPRAPFRFHGVPDRELAAPAAAGAAAAWPPRASRTATPARSASARSRACACSTSPRSGPGPFATAWLARDGRRRDQGRSGAATRRHPLQRGGAPATRTRSSTRSRRCSTRRTSASAGSRSTSVIPTGSTLAKRLVARADVVVENFTPRVLEQFGLDYDTVRALRPDVVMVRMPAFGLTGPWRDRPGLRADDGAAHRHGVGHRLRGRPADHPRRPRRPDGRHARRARDSSPRSSTARAPARASSSKCRWSRSRPR